ncbi:unnamed protein product, partial [Heterosigma akashiwo]
PRLLKVKGSLLTASTWYEDQQHLSRVLPLQPFEGHWLDIFVKTMEETQLLEACSRGHSQIVKQLLEKGAVIEARDQDQYTSLHLASEEGFEPVVQLLLAAGADKEARAHGQ